MDEAADGIVLRQTYDWRNISLTFVVKEAKDEDAAYRKISSLTQALKNCTIRFDDIDLDFYCILDGSTQPERLQNGTFKVVFNLKNDWGRGDKVAKEWDIIPVNGKMIKINYKRNWATMEGYSVCFDANEVEESLGSADIYIDLNRVEAIAQNNTNWTDFFLDLGVAINKYKETNEQNGVLDIDEVYSVDAAKQVLQNRNQFSVTYNRFHKDGYADFPGPKTFPSLVWNTKSSNTFYFNTDVGAGWNAQDITVSVIGRWYRAQSGNSGGMFGAKTDNYGLTLVGTTAYYDAMGIGSYGQTVIGSSSSSGGGFVIETVDDLASLPLREYAIKSAKYSDNPAAGYADFVFDGKTLTRGGTANKELTQNITIGLATCAHQSTMKCAINCDIARVRIYHNGELVRDFIPIDGSLKNGFVNNYDTGFYDVITMTYIPWSLYGNDNIKGPAPNGYMPIPA